MGLTFTPEQQEFRHTVRSFLAQKSPEREVRRLMETEEGYDPEVWSQMAHQLGLQGLAVPEEYGGAGFGFVEVSIVLEEAGRALLCGPLLSSYLASAALLLVADDTANHDLLPGIASGATIATVALTEASGRWDPGATSTAARRTGDQWTLSGEKSYVTDGHIAAVILVPAQTPEGISLFVVEGDAPGLSRSLLTTLDQTRKLASLTLRDVPARLIGKQSDGAKVLEKLLRVAAVALANEQVGVAELAMEMSAQYAKERIQFGRPIGSFQAIKHMCADLLVAVESSKSAAYYAAAAVADDADDLEEVAALAASFCSEACLLAGHDNIQIHGGIGFTWEHPAHLYYKRAKSSELLFGDTAHHRELLARAIGL